MSEQQTSSASVATTLATSALVTPANPINASPNMMSANAASIRSPLPQVQVIHQPMHSPPFPLQFPYNQQIMLQNAAAMQAAAMQMNMNPQQLNMANMAVAMQQGRPPSVSANVNNSGLMSPNPTNQAQQGPGMASVTPITATSTSANSGNNNGKGVNGNKSPCNPPQTLAQVSAQAQALVAGKQMIAGQPGTAGPPLLLGQIGTCVLSGGQVTTTPTVVSQQAKGCTLAVTQACQPHLISSQAPIRFSQPQLVSSTGQIISSQPVLANQAVLQAMANLHSQGIPLTHQPLLSNQGQSPTFLAGNSVYIRPVNSLQPQQNMMAGMQAMNMKGKVMDMSGNLQVKPCVASAPVNKHMGAGVAGKTILPSTSKSANTAKVQPTSLSVAPKLNIPSITKQAKGRAKAPAKIAASIAPASGNVTVPGAQQLKPALTASVSKPATPTSQAQNMSQSKSQSDSELETARKKTALEAVTDKLINDKKAELEKDQPSPSDKGNKCKDEDDPENGEKCADGTVDHHVQPVVEKQKAIVKPHILTHIIDGFVIQEGPEPFPVQRSSLLTEFIPPKPDRPNGIPDDHSRFSSLPMDVDDTADAFHFDAEMDTGQPKSHFLKCEFCNKVEPASKFRKSKRFCSMACTKRYNVGCSKRLSLFQHQGRPGPGRPPLLQSASTSGMSKVGKKRKHMLSKMRKGWRSERGGRLSYNTSSKLPGSVQQDMIADLSSSNSGQEDLDDSSSSPSSPPQLEIAEQGPPFRSPTKWTVNDVYEFIKSLPGCDPYAEEFRSQEIDGQALMLLKEDHLMTAMNMKLGPALKICARINSMKDEFI